MSNELQPKSIVIDCEECGIELTLHTQVTSQKSISLQAEKLGWEYASSNSHFTYTCPGCAGYNY